MKLSRNFLTAITLLSTTAACLDSMQAAAIPVDMAVIIPSQATVASTHIAIKKKPGAKKKPGVRKKPSSAVNKPEEVPSTPPEDVPKQPEQVPGQGAPGNPGANAPGVPGPGQEVPGNTDVPGVPGQNVPKPPGT